MQVSHGNCARGQQYFGMMIRLLLFLFPFAPPVLLALDEPALGDGKKQVIRVLGQPQGAMRTAGKEVLFYSRGLVNLEHGKVDQVDLLSEADLEAFKRQVALREEIKQLEEEAARRAKIAQGREQRDRILADESFETRPASVRLHAWDTFKRRFPDVPVDAASYQRALEQAREQEAREQAALQEKQAAEAAKKDDPGPRPKISSKRIKKMRRAGTWKWSEAKE